MNFVSFFDILCFMDITLEQARVFESVARLGTIQKAANELNRGHSAVLYSLKCLEEQTQLTLFERGGYRNRISLEGEIVLKYCKKLLETRNELSQVCQKIKNGWEPSLKLVYDEVVDFNFIGSALYKLSEMQPPTEVKILSTHLDDVENLFQKERAGLMVTILPLQRLQIPSVSLRPITMHLVAHKNHKLGGKLRRALTTQDLNRHTFVAVKTPSRQIGLSTEGLNFDSYFLVTSFMTKKLAIMNQLGFGWLPDYLIKEELRKGVLVNLKTDIKNKILVYPKLYHQPEEILGKAAKGLLRFLTELN